MMGKSYQRKTPRSKRKMPSPPQGTVSVETADGQARFQMMLPIVQKQVGHRSLKTTSVYLSASTEKMARAYDKARQGSDLSRKQATYAV